MLKVKNIDENNLRKGLPNLSINKEDLYNIATSNNISTTNYVSYEDGFWEIQAKQQELFTPKILE